MASTGLRVLVPLDGSRESESVLRPLHSLAGSLPLRLTLLRVVPTPEKLPAARLQIGRSAAWLKRRGCGSNWEIVIGETVDEILSFARQPGADWIAMSTHGRGGLRRAVMGSVTEEVLHRTKVPLLITRPDVEAVPFEHLVVALDGSREAERILPDVSKLALALSLPVHLMRASLSPLPVRGFNTVPLDVLPRSLRNYLRARREELRQEGVVALPAVRRGAPAVQIRQCARELGPSLICMTTHGQTGFRRVLLGSVAEEVIRKAPFPVLVRRITR